MKLVCNLPSIDDLNDFKEYADAVLIKYKENILSTIQKVLACGILPILQWDEMVLPEEIEEYRNQIELTKDLGCMYYVTDLGLAHLLKKANALDRVIFDPITMITNSLDAKEFQDYGFHAIGLSNEITLEDTKQIIEKSKAKAFLQVFGYRLMLSTRRKLVSLYAEKIESDFPKENLRIQEATREDCYPIIETAQGTKIYRSQMIHLISTFKELPLEYAYLNGLNLEKETFLKVLKAYSNIRNGLDVEPQIEELEPLHLPTGEGFTLQDTVYNKEEF